MILRREKKISDRTILQFTQTMSELLKSGVSLQQALEILKETDSKKWWKNFCGKLLVAVNNGNSFSKALEIFKKELGTFYIELVTLGENSNCLTKIMENLCDYLKAREKISSKIKQALIYPAMICITAVFVALAIVFVVFPKIASVFEVFTESSQAVGATLEQIRFSVICVSSVFGFAVLSAAILFILYKTNKNCRKWIQAAAIRLPVCGKLIRTINTRDFVFVMKLMCRSGISFSQALERSCAVIRNSAYKNEIEKVHQRICNGEDIVESFRQSKVFPSYMVMWLSIAVATGNLEGVFGQINEFYTSQVNKVMEEFMTLIEPTLIFAVGIFMFYVVVQFVLPVFSLLGSI